MTSTLLHVILVACEKFSKQIPYISLWDELTGLVKRSYHFLSGDHFINGHNHFSLKCIDIVRSKLMLFKLKT